MLKRAVQRVSAVVLSAVAATVTYAILGGAARLLPGFARWAGLIACLAISHGAAALVALASVGIQEQGCLPRSRRTALALTGGTAAGLSCYWIGMYTISPQDQTPSSVLIWASAYLVTSFVAVALAEAGGRSRSPQPTTRGR